MQFLSAKWRLTQNSQQYCEMTKLSPKSSRMNSIIIQFTLLNFNLSNNHVRLLPNVTFSPFLAISIAHVLQLRHWLRSVRIQARRRCSMITVPGLLWLVLFHLDSIMSVNFHEEWGCGPCCSSPAVRHPGSTNAEMTEQPHTVCSFDGDILFSRHFKFVSFSKICHRNSETIQRC